MQNRRPPRRRACPIVAKQGWGTDGSNDGSGISSIPHPSQKAKDGAPTRYDENSCRLKPAARGNTTNALTSAIAHNVAFDDGSRAVAGVLEGIAVVHGQVAVFADLQ